jgi:hypothetical protein
MSLPHNLKVYSAVCSTPASDKQYSVRFLLTPEEFESMMQDGVLPPTTEEVVGLFALPHDFHEMPTTPQ